MKDGAADTDAANQDHFRAEPVDDETDGRLRQARDDAEDRDA